MGILFLKEMACLKKVCICLFFFVEEISVDMVEEQVIKYTDPYLLGEKYFRVSNHMEEHWK